MSEDEVFVFIFSFLMAAIGTQSYKADQLPAISRRDNAGPGLIRLAVCLGMGWITYILFNHADPSVKGMYHVFYLVMGYGILQCFGKAGAHLLFGVHARIDAGERQNFPAAIFVAAFTLGTGILFGGSLWGDADPTGGGDEGGWWIPFGFFFLGWSVLVSALSLYCWRESGSFRKKIRQDRDTGAAVGAASFILSTSVLMLEAVSGDFWGWKEGLKDIGLAAGLLVIHEFINNKPGDSIKQPHHLRWIESIAYFGVVALNTALMQWIR